jgi:hypothetical protein
MKKIFTLFLSVLLFTAVMAQKSADVTKTTVKPIIDGIVDEVWAKAEKNAINVVFRAETPTVGESWWKMVWDNDGMYLLVFVDDDVYMPAHMGNTPSDTWKYDKVEVYFDVNYVKADGKGPAAVGTGHYQFAETPLKAIENGGTTTTRSDGVQWAFNATDRPTYYVEYFFPFDILKDKDGLQVDKSEPIGFDVNIMDNDVVDRNFRYRMNWSHAGVNGENNNNMDEAGIIVLLSTPTYVDAIITSDICKVYPNPVGNGSYLIVELKANTKVAIYNAVGQKMVEKISTGNVAKFDVSSLRQGMYFVKTSDGNIHKFIR